MQPSTQSLPPPDVSWSFDFRGETLQQVLETVARVTETDMVYDPKMIGDVVIFKRIRELPMPVLLSEILSDTPFDYIMLSSGTMVIVRKVADQPAYGSFSGKVRDSHTGKPLHGATVLLADASGGTATNQSGVFNLNRMMSGSYRIIISYVGYNTVEKVVEIVPDEHIRTEVALEPRPFSFTPMVIQAHRPDLAGIDNRAFMQSLNTWDISGGRRDPIRSLGMFAGLQYGLPLQDIHLQGGRQGEHRIRLDGIPVYNPYNFGHFYSTFSPLAIRDVQLHKAGFGAEQGSMISGIIDFRHDLPSNGNSGFVFLVDPVNVNIRGDLSWPRRSGIPDWSGRSGQRGRSDRSGMSDRSGQKNDPFGPGSGDSGRITPASTLSPEYLHTAAHSAFSVTGSLRSNFWDLYQEPNLQQTLNEWGYVDQILAENLLGGPAIHEEYESLKQVPEIRYLDGHFALRYEPGAYHTIGASMWYGQNRIRLSSLNQRYEDDRSNKFLFTRDDYAWRNFVGQISWDASPGPRITISTRAGLSSSRMDHHYHMNTRDSAERSWDGIFTAASLYLRMESDIPVLPQHDGFNRIDHGLLETGMQYSLSPEFRIDTGIELNIVSSKVDFSEFFFLPTSSDESSVFGTVYANLNRTFGKTWQVTAGSRFTRIDTHDDIFAEPRLSVQHDRNNTSIGYWSARFAAGIYRQFIHQYDITNVGPTSMVPSFTVWSHASADEPPKAYHLSGSWINQPAALTTLKLEVYYKWEPTSFISSTRALATDLGLDRASPEAFSESTRLRARGFSFRLHQLIADPRIKMMLGYDYSQSELEMPQFGRTLPASWNEPHRIQARGIVNLYGPVSLIANWKSVYGRAWGFRQAYYDYLFVKGMRTIGGEFRFGTPEKDRLPAFHQLDLSIRYRPNIGSLRMDLHLDLINVLNRRNVIDWSLKPAGMIATQPPQPPAPNGEDTSGDFDITYEIHERTMPGFYPVLRLEMKL